MTYPSQGSPCSLASKQQPIAYLVSEYPAVSHTFIQREIAYLRGTGQSIVTASIKLPSDPQVLDPAAQAEYRSTFYIKSNLLRCAIRDHYRTFRRAPWGYAKMLFGTFRLGTVRSLGYFLEAGVLLNWMQEKGANHVHVHFANAAATVSYLASLTGLCTYSLSVHGPDVFDDVYNGALPQKLKGSLFVRSISKYCTAQVRRWLPYDQWNKIHVVRCGVADGLPPTQGSMSGPPHILCVGRLCSAKGQHQLLEASRALLDQGIDHRLTLVGSGPDATSLKELTQRLSLGNSVTFTGPLGQDKVQELYGAADLFVLPSYAEGVPVVLMEAMARAVPVVSTRITGIPELIEHDQTGVLVTPADHHELVSALAALIRDGVRRKRLGEQGRAFVAKEYGLFEQLAPMGAIFNQYLEAKDA